MMNKKVSDEVLRLIELANGDETELRRMLDAAEAILALRERQCDPGVPEDDPNSTSSY